MCNLKYGTNEPICKTERLTDIENRLGVAKEKGDVERMDGEFKVNRCKLLHLKWIDNKFLLYSTWKYSEPTGVDPDGKRL